MLDIILILDESTSMSEHKDSYIKGVNSLLSTQKFQNPMANFTLIKFASNITTVCVDSKIYTLPEFTEKHYNPNGVTALYDAIGEGINLKCGNNINNVIMIIITDGEDNHSSKYTFQSISDKIKYFKSRGWEFVFIATNQNVTQIGTKLGIDTCLAYNASPQSIFKVANACNIAIGHAIQKWSGVPNIYTNQQMPTDVRDLMNGIESIKF